jgi:hypothetical protein
MLVEEVQDVAEVADVGGPVLAEDEDIVEVHEDEGYTIKNPIHHPLERLGRIPKAERHLQKLVEAKRGHNRRLEDVRGRHRNLVVTLNEVQLREHCAAVQIITEILYVRERILIWQGAVVQAAIIATGSPGPVRLRDHVEGRGPRRVGPANDASPLHPVELRPGS